MNILLVNDDGYQAEGIRTLDEVLSKYGHKIFLVAPEKEQSGKSHSMTVRGALELTEYSHNHYYLAGSPADCIIFPIKGHIFEEKIDLVVSGINHGYNQSTDITYSGTCGAARQASLYGMKAIAISVDREKGGIYDFKAAAEFLANHLELFVPKIHGDVFLNINVPPKFSGEWELADLGAIDYEDKIEITELGNNKKILKVSGLDINYRKPHKSKYRADFEVTKDNKASVSFIDIHQRVSYPHFESNNE